MKYIVVLVVLVLATIGICYLEQNAVVTAFEVDKDNHIIIELYENKICARKGTEFKPFSCELWQEDETLLSFPVVYNEELVVTIEGTGPDNYKSIYP